MTPSCTLSTEIKMPLLFHVFTKVSSVLLSAFAELSHGHWLLGLNGALPLPSPYTTSPHSHIALTISEYVLLFKNNNLLPLCVAPSICRYLLKRVNFICNWNALPISISTGSPRFGWEGVSHIGLQYYLYHLLYLNWFQHLTSLPGNWMYSIQH